MNHQDINNLREMLRTVELRIDEYQNKLEQQEVTPEVFEQKLINVFKAGLLAGRKQQYDEIIDRFKYGTTYIDICAGNLNITGDIDYDDIGVTGTIEDYRIEEEWGDCKVDMERIDEALSKFKPEYRDTETPES